MHENRKQSVRGYLTVYTGTMEFINGIHTFKGLK